MNRLILLYPMHAVIFVWGGHQPSRCPSKERTPAPPMSLEPWSAIPTALISPLLNKLSNQNRTHLTDLLHYDVLNNTCTTDSSETLNLK